MSEKNMSGKNKLIAILVVAFIIVAVGSYFIGAKTGKAKTSLRGNFQVQGGQQGQGTGIAGQSSAGRITGEIIWNSDTSFTVRSANGSSKIVFLSGATDISKSVSGTASDLTVGTNVTVAGASDKAGIIAQTVDIRPATTTTTTNNQSQPQQDNSQPAPQQAPAN